MSKLLRPSSVIKKQIEEFKALFPQEPPSPTCEDFAAQLQWNSWITHLQELDDELQEVLISEAQ